MAKRSVGKSGAHHERNAKAVLSFLILFTAAVVFYVFINYQNNLSGNISQLFMILVAGLFALLVGLLYLVSKPHTK